MSSVNACLYDTKQTQGRVYVVRTRGAVGGAEHAYLCTLVIVGGAEHAQTFNFIGQPQIAMMSSYSPSFQENN